MDGNSNNKQFEFFVCDSTLRDGEQVAGIHYTAEQKMKIAQVMDEMGIESIDAGFAATSAEERQCIKAICSMNLNMRIMSMCRVKKSDVDYAIECGVDGVILFIPGSDIHIKAKFGDKVSEKREDLVSKAIEMIRYAKSNNLFVEFGIEDSSRTDMSTLIDIFKRAELAGADALGTTDTVGAFTPEKIYKFIKTISKHVQKPIGVHCHNDFGLATANTIAGLLGGAGYISTTVNGFGERAGNAPLEEVLMALNVLYNQELRYNTKLLGELADIVEQYSGKNNSIFKPIVGKNAYSHESGIHIHGMIKDNRTYEMLNPKLVGRSRAYVIGKHAGKHLISYILSKNGYDISDCEAKDIWEKMKVLNDEVWNYSEQDIVNKYLEEKKGNV